MKRGDQIIITCNGRAVEGEIKLISENQVSALITFEALLGTTKMHAGTMPIFRGDDGVYRSIIDGTEVSIELKDQP